MTDRMAFATAQRAHRPSDNQEHGTMSSTLTVIETPWTIEGDPDAAWVWGEPDPQGTPKTLGASGSRPTGIENTRIHTSEHDQATGWK